MRPMTAAKFNTIKKDLICTKVHCCDGRPCVVRTRAWKKTVLALEELEKFQKAHELLLKRSDHKFHETTPPAYVKGFAYALGWAQGLFQETKLQRRPDCRAADQPGGKPGITDASLNVEAGSP